MGDDLVMLERAVMEVGYDDMIRLSKFCSEGQSGGGVHRVYDRFPDIQFLQSQGHTATIAVGERPQLAVLRATIYNVRKMDWL